MKKITYSILSIALFAGSILSLKKVLKKKYKKEHRWNSEVSDEVQDFVNYSEAPPAVFSKELVA